MFKDNFNSGKKNWDLLHNNFVCSVKCKTCDNLKWISIKSMKCPLV